MIWQRSRSVLPPAMRARREDPDSQGQLASCDVEIDAPLARYGIDSRQALAILRELEAFTGRKLSATAMWEWPTVEGLVAT